MDKKGNYLALIMLEALEDENMKACKKLLITYKANPNILVVDRGIAPIHYACGMENVTFAEEIVKLMLELGGDPNVRSDEKLTPLHVASIWGRKNIVKMLLEKGGDLYAKDEESKTPILYAIYEYHFDVVKIFQNHTFEKKIEEKKKELLYKNTINGNNFLTNNKEITIENNNLLMIKNLEEKKYTPNRINYNFDVTSPYYINITHRKKYPKENNTSKETFTVIDVDGDNNENETQNEESLLKSYHTHIPTNLFELTEENLAEYAKKMSPERSKISFIKTWREKVQKAKTRKSIINHFNDIDLLLNSITNDANVDFTNTTFFIDGQDIDNADKEQSYKPEKPLNLTQFGKLLEQLKQKQETDESFVTAKNELQSSTASPEKNFINDECSNFIRTPIKDEYVMQMAEEFVHTDPENGLVFYEKHIITNDLQNRRGSPKNVAALNKSHTSGSTDFTVPLDYDTDHLRKELTNFGETPGPITKSTKRLYMKRLIKYKRNPEKMSSLRQKTTEDKNNSPKFSVELEKTIRNKEWFKKIDEHMGLEFEVTENFKAGKDLKNEWREGHVKTSFIYLLIDPRISDNLPAQSLYTEKHDIWQKFLSSIFYVGKGKSIRPYQHLYDAMKIFSRFHEKETKETFEKVTIYGGQKIPKIKSNHLFGIALNNVTDSKKIERILDIWKSEKGVICLHVFHNILPAEAYTREAAIIDAIGLEHLTNIKRGDYYGISKTWSMRQRKCLGIALLYKALQIFLVEGESQLLPSDLI